MFELISAQERPLRLFISIMPQNNGHPKSRIDLGYAFEDVVLPAGSWTVLGNIELSKLLSIVNIAKSSLTILPEETKPHKQSFETFIASLKLSLEQFQSKLSKNEAKYLEKIINNLEKQLCTK